MKKYSLVLLILLSQIAYSKNPVYTTTKPSNLYQENSKYSAVITIVPEGSKVEVIQSDDILWFVRYNTEYGYIEKSRLKGISDAFIQKLADEIGEPKNNHSPSVTPSISNNTSTTSVERPSWIEENYKYLLVILGVIICTLIFFNGDKPIK